MAAASRKKNLAILITLLCVIILGAGYFFIYIPNNEKRLKAQRHLSLQNIDRNIHEKIANGQALMANLLKDSTPIAYINHLSRSSAEAFSIEYSHTNARDKRLPLPDSVIRLRQNANIITTTQIVLDDSARQVRLVLQKRDTSNNDTLTHRLIMRFTLHQFFDKLLPRNVFEEYVVFANREAIYTTALAGVSNLKDSLFGKGSGTLPDKEYTLAGIDYRLFSHPVRPVANKELVVAGLVSEARYQQERKKLPFEVVLLLLTALIAIVIALPWLKLFLMGNKDRLRTTDAIASIVVSMLLMSLLFFSFFKYNIWFRPSNNEDPKKVLATEISKALQAELDSAYHHLATMNAAVQDDSLLRRNLTIADSKWLNDSAATVWAIRKDTTIRQVFWLDSAGVELANWTWDTRNAPHGNFSHRAYFQQLLHGQPMQLNGNPGKPFYLDQVVSWTDGKFTSVLSMPSKGKHDREAAVAMSLRLHSLYQPLLTPGYQFAMVDAVGRVLYHSDESRNLNEDLAMELLPSDRLKSALEARVSDAFLANYFGKQYTVSVQPLEHLPYSVVVFSNLEYRETREMAIYSFTFSLFFILCLLFVLQLFVVFLVSARRSFFKKQAFDTSWVAPKQKSHVQYNLAILANSLILLLAVCFFKDSTFLTYVFILVFSVNFVSFFLNVLFAIKYYERGIWEYLRFKLITLSALFILAVALNIVAVLMLDGENFFRFLLYQILAIVPGALLFFFRKRVEKWGNDKLPKRLRKRWTFGNSFALMTLTRLLLTSALPVAFFYVSAYNYEQNISVRYRQVQYGRQLLNRTTADERSRLTTRQLQQDGVYTDGMWVYQVGLVDTVPRPLQSAEDKLTSGMLDFFRFNFTDAAVNEDRFSVSYAPCRDFQFNPLLKDACKKDKTTITYLKTPEAKWLTIHSAKLNYQLPSVFKKGAWLRGFLFWCLVAIVMVVFYFIINTILSKLFCLRLPNLNGTEALDKKIMYNQQSNGLLFVIGLPGSGKLEEIKNQVRQGILLYNGKRLVWDDFNPAGNTVVVGNMLSIPDTGTDVERMTAWSGEWKRLIDKRWGLVIVNHFEYNIQDAVTNRVKLNFLESLMIANTAKVIILSTIHPMAFLDSVREQSASTGKDIPGEDIERWHVLFGHFRIVVLQLQRQKMATPSGPFYDLYKETEYTHFLNKLQCCTVDIALGKGPLPKPESLKSDELIYKLQMSSHYFYMYIWQSLTKEEKFLLYDLAEDDLVNPFDDYNLNMLLAKGVIRRRNGTLTLFNRGFRNFILTAIGNSEAAKIRSRIEDNGRWGNLRTPLLIIIAAILGFLLASEEEAYSRLLTYIAALGAGIPAVLKLLSLFDKRLEKN